MRLVTMSRAICLPAMAICFAAALAGKADDDETITPQELAAVKAAEAARVRTIEQVYGAVVAIYGIDRQGGGSGVLYDAAGLALTNHHVVAAAGDEGWAGLADGKLYRWKLIGTDPGGDVAIIQLQGRDSFPVAPLGDSDRVRVGDWAMAMGNPFVLAEDQKPTVTLGIVSGIERYQAGSGLNALVYGNCIQVDSSINPGNSGGPLFSIFGQVIGINGRASFLERGRVNVGLGYAISINQIKLFLPDLLATKIAQHGTLDAQFGNRGGQVICHTLNLDSPAARRGLQLGDRLIAFEGRQVDDANQFTNLISTLPADWPVELTYERDGAQQTIWVRLLALPYDLRQFEPPEMPPAEDQKDGEAPKKSPPEKPAEKPQDKVETRPPTNVTPGVIRDEPLNQQNCRRIVQQWKAASGVARLGDDVKALRITDDVVRGERTVGRHTLLLATDGRFRVEYDVGKESFTAAFDGQRYWHKDSASTTTELSPAKALLNPFISQAATLAALFHEEPLSQIGKVLLDGGDKAQGRVAYRLKSIDAAGDWFYVWLSVLDDGGQPHVELLKSGPDVDADPSRPAVLYADWREIGGLRFPFRRSLVKELAERENLRFVARDFESLKAVSDSEFASPSDVGQK
jgi:serine protease Do